MSARRAVSTITLGAVLLLGAPTAAVAFDAGQGATIVALTEEPSETTTTAPSSGLTPAVEAPAPDEDKSTQPWTARFLAPLILLLGLAALVAAVAYYGVRIKRRYRISS
jgi:hypothetical protein